MPYQIKEETNKDEEHKFVVYNTDTGKKKGSFDTRQDAMKKMKALYADPTNEEKDLAAADSDEDEDDEADDTSKGKKKVEEVE